MARSNLREKSIDAVVRAAKSRSRRRSTSRSTPSSLSEMFRKMQLEDREGSILARYEKIDIPGLGSGWDAYVHKRTRECYVCKSIKRNQIAKNQIKIMELLREEENIGIKGVYEVGDCVKIIMEPCVGQRLSERIEMKEKHRYREAAKLTKIILKVIMTCHSRGVTLGNLKETFIFANKHDDSSLKAMYFGSAEQPASEVREEKRRIDIQLAGEILFLLVTGKKKMRADPQRSSGWTNLPEEAKDLISKMLTDDRVTAEQVLRDIRRSIDQAGADYTRLNTAVRNLERIKIGEKRTRVNRQN